jgi:hypothetical protein
VLLPVRDPSANMNTVIGARLKSNHAMYGVVLECRPASKKATMEHRTPSSAGTPVYAKRRGAEGRQELFMADLSASGRLSINRVLNARAESVGKSTRAARRSGVRSVNAFRPTKVRRTRPELRVG